jgi:hypothetical protein
MAKSDNMVFILGGIAVLAIILFSSSGSGGSSAGFIFDFSQLVPTYGQDNVNRLTDLYSSVAQANDPNTGSLLSNLQIQLMLDQALHESGIFTNVANLNLVDNFHNYTGIKGNSNYPAGAGSSYADYPSIDAFVQDWLRVLNLGAQPIEATSVTDFVNRLASNNYFVPNTGTAFNNYLNDMQAYDNLLTGVKS